jgi:hypothetical protein
MNAKTLADFRVGHGAALEDPLADSFASLVMAGVASLDRVAQDGVRVRASAGAASFRRHSTLEDCREEAAQAVRCLREDASRDPSSASRHEAAAQLRAGRDRESGVEKALTVTRELHGQQQDRARRREERVFRANLTARSASGMTKRHRYAATSLTAASAGSRTSAASPRVMISSRGISFPPSVSALSMLTGFELFESGP